MTMCLSTSTSRSSAMLNKTKRAQGMKPILVTRITEDKVEVLMDYQSTMVNALTTHNELLSFTRGSHSSTEEGLIGAIFTVDVTPSVTELVLQLKHYKDIDEYIFKV